MRMLSWVAAGIAGLAVLTVLRWAVRRVDALERRQPFPYATVARAPVLAGRTAPRGALRVLTEGRLGGIASPLTGKPVAIQCQSLGGAVLDIGAELGYV